MKERLLHVASQFVDHRQRCIYCGLVLEDLKKDRVERNMVFIHGGGGWEVGTIVCVDGTTKWDWGRIPPESLRFCRTLPVRVVKSALWKLFLWAA